LKIAALVVSSVLSGMAALTVPAIPAVAADFVVSDCGDSGGPDQLRAKIDAANTALGGNITFSCGPATITLGSALPNILTEITIDGGGNIELSGNDTVTVLNSFSTLHLVDLAIVAGRVAGNAGALYTANSTLTMDSVTIENSRAQNDGGALYVNNSTVSIEDSSFAGNEAGGDGGAIYNFKGTLTLENVDIDGNKAGAYAGALFNDGGHVTWAGGRMTENDAYDAGAVATLDRGVLPGASTDLSFVFVSGNEAVNGAGAFYVFPAAALEVSDSAIGGNEAGGDGGALYNEGSTTLERVLLRANTAVGAGGAVNSAGGTTSIVSSTLYQNAGLIGSSVANGEGEVEITNATIVGGASMTASILQYSTGSTLLTNTILEAGASPINCDIPDEEPGTIGSGNHNISDDESCEDFLTELSDLSMADAMLGPLKNNGGVTDTMVPQEGSVAVDATDEACPDDDQRGVTRPSGVQCDIGAVEVALCGESVPDLCGDANADGTVTAPDALQALRTSVGTTTCEIWLCDFNGSGGTTAADALAILRTAVGQQLQPNCPAPYDCLAYL
jgi:predicted outer membrane repeat protein